MTEQMLPELLPTSRFQIYASPIVSPGKCAVCGAVDQPVLDYGQNIDFYGAVLICTTNCLPEAARAIGMVDRAYVKAAEEAFAQSLDEQLKARNLVAMSKENYDAIRLGFLGISDGLFSADSGYPNVVAGQAGEGDYANDAGADESKSGTVGSPEQDDNAAVGEGPNGVSSNSGNGDSDFTL